MQKDDTSVWKQDENSRLAMDAGSNDNDAAQPQHHEKPVDSLSNSRPAFHRPFLDIEDSSPQPRKLYKVCVGEVQNGIRAVPLHTDSLSSLLQKTKTPVCGSKSAGSMSEDSGSHCEAGELDEQGPHEGEHSSDDGGRDKRLHAALGLISLADVSADVVPVRRKSCTETPTEECSFGEILHIFPP